MKRTLFAIIVLCCTASVGYGEELAQVPIDAEYRQKVVYTTDPDVDKEPLRKDCEARGGRFNECGSPCDEREGDGCISVCAATCELDK